MTWLDKVRDAQSTLEALMRDNKDEMDTEAALAFRSFIELTQAVEAIGRHVKCPLMDLDFQPGDEQLRPGPML